MNAFGLAREHRTQPLAVRSLAGNERSTGSRAAPVAVGRCFPCAVFTDGIYCGRRLAVLNYADITADEIAKVRAVFDLEGKKEYKSLVDWDCFFVQQVYKGGDSPKEGGSPENIVAKSGATFTSGNMGELYVGPNKDENFKINDFGEGTAKTYPNVLNNHADINNGGTHPDEIMLMVNIDDTSCFGYHETGSSTHHDNKWALVSAATIGLPV